MSRIIVVANQKGGVGKTTTAINFASSLASYRRKVLLIDMDPQGNSTAGVGLERKDFEKNIYECIIDNIDPFEAVYSTKVENFEILPADINLAGAQVELIDAEKREYALKGVTDKLKKKYDYIIIDTPPSLGILTINGLVAANSILIPLQCEYYALEGLTQLLNTIKLIQKKLNTELDIEGILLTMFDSRTNISTQVVEEVTAYFKDKVFKTIIPRNVKLSEAPSFGLPINLYDAQSTGSSSYAAFTKEVIDNETK